MLKYLPGERGLGRCQWNIRLGGGAERATGHRRFRPTRSHLGRRCHSVVDGRPPGRDQPIWRPNYFVLVVFSFGTTRDLLSWWKNTSDCVAGTRSRAVNIVYALNFVCIMYNCQFEINFLTKIVFFCFLLIQLFRHEQSFSIPIF